MSTAAPPLPPPRLIQAMKRMTAAEADAVDEYRVTVSRMFHQHRAGRLTKQQVASHWRHALDQLGTHATGSPQFDKYVALQVLRHVSWLRQVGLPVYEHNNKPNPTGSTTERITK